MAKTTIINYDERGNVVFRSETPRILTEQEMRAECEAWAADYENATIIYEN